jgi:hypothetical protein
LHYFIRCLGSTICLWAIDIGIILYSGYLGRLFGCCQLVVDIWVLSLLVRHNGHCRKFTYFGIISFCNKLFGWSLSQTTLPRNRTKHPTKKWADVSFKHCARFQVVLAHFSLSNLYTTTVVYTHISLYLFWCCWLFSYSDVVICLWWGVVPLNY